MHVIQLDTCRTLSRLLSDDRKRTFGFLIIGLITVVALLNPVYLGSSSGKESSVIVQSGTTYTASAITTTTQLNLTQANVNVSQSSQVSPWTLSSTAAQARINSTDATGETVSAVWQLDQSSIAQAQTIKYDFEFATSASASSEPNINASIGLTSSNYNSWYSQSGTPVYPNNTKTISILNIVGSYGNGSARRSLLLQAQQVTNAQANTSGGNSATLFQQEYSGYAGGGVLHHYSIEFDLQSNTTIWIVDDTIIAISKLSFVPSTLVFIASTATAGDLAVATLEDPVQTAVLPIISISSTPFTGQVSSGVTFQIGNLTNSLGQISSLQNQINHLNSQVGNLTSQNAQLQAKNSQWFSQWWFSIVSGLLGAVVVGSFFVTGVKLRSGRKVITAESGQGSFCPTCSGQMPPEAAFCGECGTTLREAKSICPGCGEQMPSAAVYCGDCGTQIPVGDPTSQSGAHTSASGSPDENRDTWR